MALHRTSRLKIYGDAAEVEKLINNRWRVTVRCLPSNKMEDWFYENRGQTFSDFNSTMDDEIPVDGILRGWSARDGESWKDARLISQSVGYTRTGDYVVTLVYETLTLSWVGVEADTIRGEANGLRTLGRTLVAEARATAPYDEDDVGVSTITDGGKTLYLSGFSNQSDERMGRFVEQWSEAGIVNAYTGFSANGLLLVTFESQGIPFTPTALNPSYTLTDDPTLAFQGGAAAPLFRNRIENVNGFRRYIRSVLLNLDGSALADGSTVLSKEIWVQQTFPGTVSTSSSAGLQAIPGATRWVKATLVENMTTSGNVDATPPYAISQGAYAYISWVPTETGVAQNISRGFNSNYLAGTAFSGVGGTFLGAPVDAVATSVSSNPSKSAWLALSGVRLGYSHKEDFVTDEGQRWYRETIVTLIGAFSDYA